MLGYVIGSLTVTTESSSLQIRVHNHWPTRH